LLLGRPVHVPLRWRLVVAFLWRRLILVLPGWGPIVDYGRLRNEALLGNVALGRHVAGI